MYSVSTKQSKLDSFARILLLVYLAECTVGSSGKLISFGPVSIRMLLFGLCFVTTLPAVFQNMKKLVKNNQVIVTVALGVYWLICALIGFKTGNQPTLVWADVTGMMGLALVPGFISVMSSGEAIRKAMNVIFIGATALAAVCIVIHFAVAGDDMTRFHHINIWINERSLGGLARLTSGIDRIYLKSQIFLQVGILYGVWLLGNKAPGKRLWVYLAMGIQFCGWVLSYTRGFWLGLLISALIIFVMNPREWKLYLKASGAMLSIFCVFLLMSSSLYGGSKVVSEIVDRTDSSLLAQKEDVQTEQIAPDTDGDGSVSIEEANTAASKLRGQSLKLIYERIGDHPVFGNGLGENLDEIRSDGKIEYMYLDIMMKTGFVGLVLFVLTFFGAAAQHLIWEIRHRGEKKEWDSPRMRDRYLVAAFLGVALTSWFNPFLTNPMGISLLMLTSTAVYTTNKLAGK